MPTAAVVAGQVALNQNQGPSLEFGGGRLIGPDEVPLDDHGSGLALSHSGHQEDDTIGRWPRSGGDVAD